MNALRRHWQRGQSLVEFTLIVPLILTMTLTIAEFGVAFGTNMSLIEATREGARVGAVLSNGSNSYGCPGYTGAANVDPQIIAAVQRALESPGSGISLSRIDYVHIYKSNSGGGELATNVWVPAASVGAGPLVCGVHLDFVPSSTGWPASIRSSVLPPDSIGVSIRYRYQLFTPLFVIAGLAGIKEMVMTDSTVMALEP